MTQKCKASHSKNSQTSRRSSPKLLSNFALLTLLTSVALAQQPGTPPSPDPPPAAPTLTVIKTTFDAVTDELTLTYTVKNNDPEATIVVIPILELPTSLIGGKRTALASIKDGVGVYEADSFDVAPGTTRQRSITLPELTWKESLAKLWFRQNDYPLQLRLRAQTTDTDEPITPQPETTTTVKPKGPVTGVIIGALLGVVAIVIFAVLYRAHQAQKPPTKRQIIGALLTVALGWTTVIVVALALRFANLAVPLLPGAGVNDFWGGGVLGLLVQPLIVWLAKYIPLPGNPPPISGPATPPSSPPSAAPETPADK